MALSESLRRQVAERARYRCEYCHCPESHSVSSFEVEHIYPISLGGSDDLSNLGWSCAGCNAYKADFIEAVDPITGISTSPFHPRQQRWSEHFAWDTDGIIILGITPIGRATIERLRMNRTPVQNLRRLLILAGLHPPFD